MRISIPLVAAALVIPLAAQQPTYHAAFEATTDVALSTLPGGAAFAIPGLFPDFQVSGGGQFVELPNGTARLTGRVFSQSSLYSAFLFDIQLAGKVESGNLGYPPVGSPDQQMLPAAYVPTGTVDPATFYYYTQATGTLTGVRDYDGAVIALQLTGPACQVGAGANNRNDHLGLQAQFAVTVLHQPFTPFPPLTTATLAIDLPLHRTDKVTHPQVDPTRTALTVGRAMVLPGVADDYLFVPAGNFTEYEDGHAELSGTLARVQQLADKWDVALVLTSRIDPGQVNFPPAGSPVLQMFPTAYVQNGGTIDPASWHYYRVATGTLTGRDLNAGGRIDLTNATAVQYGGAAQQTNTYFGYWGAFTANVVSQPTARTIALTGNPELMGLTAVFPVLPFPTLTVPATMPSLDTVTDQGIVLEGDHLAWVEYVGVNWDLVGIGDASRWFAGYFRLIDNQHLELHPRPGKAPGIYGVNAFNPAFVTNMINVDLTAPAAPALYAEPAVHLFDTLHVRMHSGPVTGQALSVVGISPSALPTVYPGLVTLGIGNSGTQLIVVGGSFAHDPVTGVAAFNLGPIPPGFTGFTWLFQCVTLDLGGFTLPLPTSNVWSVDF